MMSLVLFQLSTMKPILQYNIDGLQLRVLRIICQPSGGIFVYGPLSLFVTQRFHPGRERNFSMPDKANKMFLPSSPSLCKNDHPVVTETDPLLPMPAVVSSHSPTGDRDQCQDVSSQEIKYLYLEFDTSLPTPRIALPPGPGQLPPPEAPNLKKYISPYRWPKWRKSAMTSIGCISTAIAGYSTGEISPASDELTGHWDISEVMYNLGITIFCVGFALAPMIIAPFSEVNGRRPVFIASGILFTGRENSRCPGIYGVADRVIG